MYGFQSLGVYQGENGTYLQGISDIDLVTRDGQRWLYTTSGNAGGILALRLDLTAPGVGIAAVDQFSNGWPQIAGANGLVQLLDIGGRPALFSVGLGGLDITGRFIGGAGSFAARASLTGLPVNTTSLTPVTVEGQSFVLTTELSSNRIGVYALDGAGNGTAVGTLRMAGVTDPQRNDLALSLAETARGVFVIASSASGDAVALYRLGAGGALTETGRLDTTEGLGINAPGEARAITAYGRDFIVIPASLSSSLTVAEIRDDGSLVARDHIMDSLVSRFGGVTALEVVEVAGRPIILAGGGDGGVTALMLLPNGRLIQLAVQADDSTLSLGTVTAIEAVLAGGVLHVYAAGVEPGITHLQLDLSAMAAPLLGSAAGDLLNGGAADDLIDGGSGDDTLNGGAGDDIIVDGAGQDVMRGGAGADTFVLSRDKELDRISDFEPMRDRIDLSAWGRLYDLSAVAIIRQPGGIVVLQYGDERLIIQGRDGAWISDAALRAALVSDVFHLPTGSIVNIFDKVLVQARPGADGIAIGTLSEDHGEARLDGTILRDRLTGNSFANELYGYEGNDTLDGGGGPDRLAGGAGDDTYYIDDPGDVIVEESGFDTVFSSISTRMPSGVEALILTGLENLWARGSGGDDSITGNAGDNLLDGRRGNDTLDGGGGNDTLIGGEGNDLMILRSGPGAQTVASGGVGDDLYRLYSAGDRVVEQPDQGSDTIEAWVDLTVPRHVEFAVLAGTGDLSATGNDLANHITGNAGSNRLSGGQGNDTLLGGAGADWLSGDEGNDYLEGGMGADTMVGGAGNDVFVVDDPGDEVVELPGGGDDEVIAWMNYTIPAQIETLRLGGTAALRAFGDDRANRLIGNEAANWLQGLGGNDTLIGLDGDDRLDGGTGADQMIGGTGNDVYEVDNIGDMVIERPGEGRDKVRATISYYLAPDVEDLQLLGQEHLFGIGNESANRIDGNIGHNVLVGDGGNDTLVGYAGNDTMYGGSGNDVLNGGAGNDRMVGGDGNDTYYIGDAGDVVIEAEGGGNDLIITSRSMTIAPNVERMQLVGAVGLRGLGAGGDDWIAGTMRHDTLSGGAGNDTLLGRAGNDRLDGGAGDDRLDGGGGADTLIGGLGNDTLLADDARDLLMGGAGDDVYIVTRGAATVREAAGGGIDTLMTSVAYARLPDNIENVVLTGGARLSIDGNALDNRMTGNSASNTISGLGGNDMIWGGGGHDTLSGGFGADQIWGDAGSDLILGGGGNDTLFGGGGDDRIGGGDGNDQISGGAGRDILTGGAGADQFLFDQRPGALHADRITDFNPVSDTLMFSAAVYRGLSLGVLDRGAFVRGTAALDADDRFIYNPTTGTVHYDADGNGRAPPLLVATLTTGLQMAWHDFVIY